MKVEALNCPNCGGAVESDRTQCEFCKTRLKTVGCPKCLGLMFVGAKFCSHCGAISAPVEISLGDEPGDCPRCKYGLETLEINDVSVRTCSKCDGLWVSAATFETICADQERRSSVLNFFNERTRIGTSMTKVSYVPCPDCGHLMNRNNFARASGVIVDICKQHGIWFDADELPSIMKFIQEGGMEISRQRERNEIAQEREKLRDDQRRQVAMDKKYGNGKIFDDREESGIRGFIHSLFS